MADSVNYKIFTENGQKRYGPPEDWKGPVPVGSEVFIGKIPKDVDLDELIKMFETKGEIYSLRLMTEFNPSVAGGASPSRGFAFCLYATKDQAKKAIRELNNHEIRQDRKIGVCFSVDNCRLFVGGIPKSKTRQEILTEMQKITENVKDVIVYPSAADKSKNRGFAFVEYDCHKSAAAARKKLIPSRIELWDHQIAVDWAEPERMVDEETMAKVKILYARNLMLTTTEDFLKDTFLQASGSTDPEDIDRVKKIKDYAFIHFKHRNMAEKALEKLNGTECEGSIIEVSWAKPVDKSEPRYTRGGGRNLSIQYSSPLGNPVLVDNFHPMGQYNLSRSRSGTMPTLAPVLKTYRNAAGSRAAGSRSQFVTKLGAPFIGPHPVEALTELCQVLQLGLPSYDMQNHQIYDQGMGGFRILPVCQVMIPYLNRVFYNREPCFKPEEARAGAAQSALDFLGLFTGLPMWQSPYRTMSVSEAFDPRQFRQQTFEYETKKAPPTEQAPDSGSTTSPTSASGRYVAAPPPGFPTAGVQDKLLISGMNRVSLSYAPH